MLKHQLKKINKIAKQFRGSSESERPKMTKEQLRKKFKDAAKQFAKAATRSDHPKVPKEEQISIDLGNKGFLGAVDKILYWIQDTFKNLFPRFGFFAEFSEKRKIIGTDVEVKHFTPEEQAEHTAYIVKKNGELRLYDFTGKLCDTSGKVSKGKENSVAYAVTLDGKLVIHEHRDVDRHIDGYAYRHSTLGGGKAILCSGLIKIKDGKITYIDNNSGHYKPVSANLYNAVKILKGVFSQDAQVTCLSYWNRLKKEVSFTRKISAKKESVEKFLDKMEKEGKDELTKYQRHFKKVKDYNEQYRQKLFLANYQSPTSKPPKTHKEYESKLVSYSYNEFMKEFKENPEKRKIAVEHSIRKIIVADYGHKPEINVKYYKKKVCGINITFKYQDDYNKFTKLLDFKGYSYVSKELMPTKYTVFMAVDQVKKFINNTLKIKIDSVELLESAQAKIKIESAKLLESAEAKRRSGG